LQCKERGIDDEAFGGLLAGDVIQFAADTLYEAFCDFCPSRVRPSLTSLAKKSSEVRDLATANLTTKLQAFDQIPAEDILRSILSSGPTSSPASLASTSPPAV
jgi:hypothetical protein